MRWMASSKMFLDLAGERTRPVAIVPTTYAEDYPEANLYTNDSRNRRRAQTSSSSHPRTTTNDPEQNWTSSVLADR